MDRLAEVVLERILKQLPPSSLAVAQLVCKHWSRIILDRELWKAHAASCQGLLDRSAPAAMMPPTTQVDWRRICLDCFARQRWHTGKVVLSATLQGHTAQITSIATHNDIILTGSADSTARLWPVQQQDRAQQLARPQQQQPSVLRHPGPVVAATVVSRDVCVTATAKRAYLWRRGAAVRTFDVMPGGSITCMALTDTQLLLGSTAAVVQQFDLYSGTQQLITRYDTAVTALLPLQQQEQQQRELDGSAGNQDWSVVVGTADGQVVCTSCTTGQQLWKLPSRHRTKIIELQIVQHHQQRHHHQQQQQEQQVSQQAQRGRKRKQQQDSSLQQQNQLLLVVSASSHLTCWWLPSLATSINSSRVSCYRSSAIARPVAVQSLQQQGNLAEVSFSPGNAVYGMCMACPAFGRSCVVFGNSDGSLTVAEVVNSSSSEGADAGVEAVGSIEGSNKRRQPSSGTSTDPSSDPSTSGSSANASWGLGVLCQTADRGVSSSSDSGGVRLDVVRRCRLSKLSQVLAHTPRVAVCKGVGGCSKEQSNTVFHPSWQHADRTISSSGVRCMAFTGAGQLAIGLESGHVCILKFLHLH